MTSKRRDLCLCLRLGLALLAFSALLFAKPLEDAYVLPQRLGLGFAALLLLLGAAGRDLPATPVFWLGLALFVWRGFAHFASLSQPASLPYFSTQIPLAVLFLGACAALREAPLRRAAAAALLAAGALVAAYSLLAPLGLDPFASGALDLGFGWRTHGTLGNPDFLGGWLAMLLPLGLLASFTRTGRERALARLSTGLMALALALTLARGAWLAAALGCAVAWAAGGSPLPRARVLGAAAVLALALAGLALAAGGGVLGDKLREAADFRSEAWRSRAFMASVGWDLALERPVSGVGGGAFEMEYLRRQGERLGQEAGQPYRVTADAHNDWIQAAAETGLLGLLLWVSLFTLALRASWRAGGDWAAAAGALTAFGVQGCFHFPWDIVPTAGLALLALAAAAGADQEAPASRTLSAPWAWALGLALTASLAFTLRQAAASALLNSGASAQESASTKALDEPLLKGSVAVYGGDERAWSRLGLAQMDRQDYEGAVESYKQAIQVLPSFPEAWTNLGLSLGMLKRLPAALQAFHKAETLNPRSNEAWADEANALFQLGRGEEALRVARAGIAAAGGSPQAWFNLGGMLFNAGRPAEAAPALEQALKLQPDYPQAAELLAASRRAVR